MDGEEEEREEDGKNGEKEESMVDRGFVMKLDDQDGHCDWVIGKVVGEGEKDGKETFELHTTSEKYKKKSQFGMPKVCFIEMVRQKRIVLH